LDQDSLVAVKALYDALVERTVPVTTTREAELANLVENTFRHVNVALINEIAMFAHELGVDIWSAVEAASTKPFGFLPFRPGPGVGGHCLPVDPGFLSWRVRHDLNREFRFVSLANDINDHMPDYVVQRLAGALNRRRKALQGSVILLLGLSYKPNTGDIRDSPVLRVVELLAEQGAVIRVVDSHVEAHRCPPAVKLVPLTESSVRQADAVVLLTDHDDVDYEIVEHGSDLVLDTRNRLRGSQVEHL
jgi:UDP-N-acetyl-D-mannosaminuronic acid dehydrogenase/UDP-N-acetyl-D-glucosamine dehydrogenase